MSITLTAMLLVLAPVMVQEATPRTPTPQALPEAGASDDIIVQALRLPRDKLPMQVHWNHATALPSRIAYENAVLFMRCAVKSASPALLRRVMDGDPNSAPARFAQGSIVMRGGGCQPGRPMRSGTTVTPELITDLGGSPLDRGVIAELVLRDHAGDATLNERETADPVVRRRHDAREGPRNRLRFPNERAAWSVASCLVREQPVLATRLVRSAAGGELERGLIQAMLIEGRACLGRTKRLTIDPASFRTYVVDAFYRWVVAARGVDTLILG